MRFKFFGKSGMAKTRIAPEGSYWSPDPFREVIEFADFERRTLIDRGGLSERELGMVMAYGHVVRAALEATGMMPREVLK